MEDIEYQATDFINKYTYDRLIQWGVNERITTFINLIILLLITTFFCNSHPLYHAKSNSSGIDVDGKRQKTFHSISQGKQVCLLSSANCSCIVH